MTEAERQTRETMENLDVSDHVALDLSAKLFEHTMQAIKDSLDLGSTFDMTRVHAFRIVQGAAEAAIGMIGLAVMPDDQLRKDSKTSDVPFDAALFGMLIMLHCSKKFSKKPVETDHTNLMDTVQSDFQKLRGYVYRDTFGQHCQCDRCKAWRIKYNQ